VSTEEVPPGMEKFSTGNQVLFVHARERCKGHCPIHRPSDHSMKEWPLHWREDKSIFERICPHNIGHPDPDSLTYLGECFGEEHRKLEEIHGCDSCCLREKHVQ